MHLGVRITRLVYDSLPGVPVAGLLYQLDAPAAGRRREAAGVVFVCGHQGTAKRVAEFQGVCLDLALHGLVMLAIDPWGQGEREQYPAPSGGRPLVPPGTFEHSYSGLQCLLTGGGVCRYFAWDAVRAVDVLAALPEVDPARIGVAGNSGGGVQTTMLMMADERLAAAMPCTFITALPQFFRTGQTLDAELCFAASLAVGIDHADLLAGFAPRPLLVGGAAYDYFPVEGTEHAFQEARRLYALQGAADRIGLAVGRHLHSFGPDLREAAVRFFTRELAGEERYQRRALPPLPEDDLVCSATGQVYLDRPDGRGIYHLNRDFLAAHRRTPPASAPEAAARLRDALGPMPALDATPIRPRYFAPRHEPPAESAAASPRSRSTSGRSRASPSPGPSCAPSAGPGRPARPARPRSAGLAGAAAPRHGQPRRRPGRPHRPGPRRRAGARLRPPRARGGRGGAADQLRSLRHPPGPRGVVQLCGDPDRPLHARLARLRRPAARCRSWSASRAQPAGWPSAATASPRCGATSPPRWTSASAPPT